MWRKKLPNIIRPKASNRIQFGVFLSHKPEWWISPVFVDTTQTSTDDCSKKSLGISPAKKAQGLIHKRYKPS